MLNFTINTWARGKSSETVLMICKMLVEDHFVRHTKLFMETGAIKILLTISVFIKSNLDVILLTVWHSL